MTDHAEACARRETALYFGALDVIVSVGCRSFSDLAVSEPILWQALQREPLLRLHLALRLGWPVAPGPMETVPDALDAFLNSGIDDPAWLWLERPRQCDALHRAGALTTLYAWLGIGIDVSPRETEWVLPPFDYSARLEETIAARPPGGWPTAGGPVAHVSQLLIARMLESFDIEFVVSREAVATDEFMLSAHGCHIHLTRSLTASLRPSTPRAVWLDAGLLERPAGLMAFVQHMRVALDVASVVPWLRRPDLSDLLSPVIISRSSSGISD